MEGGGVVRGNHGIIRCSHFIPTSGYEKISCFSRNAKRLRKKKKGLLRGACARKNKRSFACVFEPGSAVKQGSQGFERFMYFACG